MAFTYEQLEKISEEAVQNCLRNTEGADTIIHHMEVSFNNGVKMMQKELLYQILMIDTEEVRKGVSA